MGFIIDKTSNIENLKISCLIHGDPKVGKTRLCGTLPRENDNEILYVSVDPGSLAIRDYEFPKVRVQDNQWTVKDFAALIPYIKSSDYKWVFIDGLDDIGEAVLRERKEANTNPLKAYDEMNNFMDWWIKSMRDIENVSTVFITHSDEISDGKGGTMVKPYLPGKKVSNDINKYFDIIGAMRFVQRDDKVVRLIQVQREADIRYMCGDRTGVLNPIEAPDLSKIVGKIKELKPKQAKAKSSQEEK